MDSGKVRTRVYKAVGGPWDGASLTLSAPCTAVFNVNGWVGRYTAHTPTFRELISLPDEVHWESIEDTEEIPE
jgi:hypothetical protein